MKCCLPWDSLFAVPWPWSRGTVIAPFVGDEWESVDWISVEWAFFHVAPWPDFTFAAVESLRFVPETSTLALLGGGLIATVWRRRRRHAGALTFGDLGRSVKTFGVHHFVL